LKPVKLPCHGPPILGRLPCPAVRTIAKDGKGYAFKPA